MCSESEERQDEGAVVDQKRNDKNKEKTRPKGGSRSEQSRAEQSRVEQRSHLRRGAR
jgi:hypothetical protein